MSVSYSSVFIPFDIFIEENQKKSSRKFVFSKITHTFASLLRTNTHKNGV